MQPSTPKGVAVALKFNSVVMPRRPNAWVSPLLIEVIFPVFKYGEGILGATERYQTVVGCLSTQAVRLFCTQLMSD